MVEATKQYDGLGAYWWAGLGIVIAALAFEGSRKLGAWLLLLTVISMLVYAREKGKI